MAQMDPSVHLEPSVCKETEETETQRGRLHENGCVKMDAEIGVT